jgi:hypothetical protein
MTSTSELIGLVYDAVRDGSLWQSFLEAFVRATESDRGNFLRRARSQATGAPFAGMAGLKSKFTFTHAMLRLTHGALNTYLRVRSDSALSCARKRNWSKVRHTASSINRPA